jgi:hypothetical protein
MEPRVLAAAAIAFAAAGFILSVALGRAQGRRAIVGAGAQH